MLRTINKKFHLFLVGILTIALFALPASGALAATQLVQNNTLTHAELTGAEAETLTQQAIDSVEVQKLLKEMGVKNINMNQKSIHGAIQIKRLKSLP